MADHPLSRSNILTNLGETLYRGGHYAAARAARALALGTEPASHPVFVTLGGYAACCAALGDIEGVKWASGQAIRLAEGARASRQLAQGLMGCADACGEIGLRDVAKDLYDRGRAMADQYGFHDLQFRADPSAPRAQSQAPAAQADAEVLASIVEMAPDGVALDTVLEV
jgi:hypothetical protein